MLSYLNFLLKSTNKHGVHSPFVYQYITKGVYYYKFYYQKKKPTEKWILASLDYFQPKTILWKAQKLERILSDWQILRVNKHKDAIVIIEHVVSGQKSATLLETITDLKDEQLLLVVFDLYPKSLLDEIRRDDSVILVVDFYYGVLISKRKEQFKQNFYIRL